MQKKKKFPLILIILILALTIYNILPTIFYYSKPLKKPISQKEAIATSKKIKSRVNNLENDAIAWVKSYAELLNVNPKRIEINSDNPELINISFNSDEDLSVFKSYIPRAGALIPFFPSQLTLIDSTIPKQLTLKRNIGLYFKKNNKSYFQYIEKFDKNLNPTEKYKDLVFDRAATIANAIGGTSEKALTLNKIAENPSSDIAKQLTYSLAQDIVEYNQIFNHSDIASSFYANFTQIENSNKSKLIDALIASFSKVRDDIKLEKTKSKDNAEKLALLEIKELNILKANDIVTKNKNAFISGKAPYSYKQIINTLEKNYNPDVLKLDTSKNSPIISAIIIDWQNDKINLEINEKVSLFADNLDPKQKQKYSQLIINEIANYTNSSGENISKYDKGYVVNLSKLTGSTSLLALSNKDIALAEKSSALNMLKYHFHPLHEELKNENFPIYDFETYKKLPEKDKNLCFIVYSPLADANIDPTENLSNGSIYIIAKGLDRIVAKYQRSPESALAKQFIKDFNRLKMTLGQCGFLAVAGSTLPSKSQFAKDFIFEKSDFFLPLLKATRENFAVYGSKKYATLEFSDFEQRILATNAIENSIHEDLIKWQDEYHTAQVSPNPTAKYDIPKPTKSVFLSNLNLSFKKYFRGDDRKILHWGLDLSGGKTVQLELRDQSNKIVKNDADIKQGINELYTRVNKMGVSDVNIRQVDSNIILDFPGAQNLSGAELIKASSMYFHVVNEKYSLNNLSLQEHVNRFLQEIWNEAVVSNKKDINSINQIAVKHLYGDFDDKDIIQPRSTSAKILYDNGLRLALEDIPSQGVFDEATNKIAIFRGDNYKDWQGQTNPLLIVFNNFALEGSNLTNINSSYDPSKGNYLSFEISGVQTIDGKKYSAKNLLQKWTSAFSKEKVMGSTLSQYTHGRGYRMAVILNDEVISSPSLEASLRDRAMITGSFTQREVNQLVADLKAGSLSFTPYILSEKNVSPELGHSERVQGIIAMAIALIAIFIAMIGYYRFAGIVASVAVLINLLIMWATLQNIGATLSLASIAGIILTVGMAVDANVLVFERIKEEFAMTGKLAASVLSGYKKAFSAILDSNVTTIIAALILLHFDAGPIKGFAITLIIGIASSMFTALFLTRYFFTHWVEKTKNTRLKMRNWIKRTNFNFLKRAKYAFIFSSVVIIIGFSMLMKEGKSVFGMDFTGGFSLNIELESQPNTDYRSLVEKALIANGASLSDFQIRELNASNNLRVMFGISMEQKGKPFSTLPAVIENGEAKYSFEKNPRIVWVVSALNSQGLKIKESNLPALESSWTAMSGQMSDTMRDNAIIGLTIALLAILIYITWRFEFKFAISAMICLLHDVFMSIATIAILNIFKVPVQIDLHTVAALMTIIGYSLNDTIIIFDRIREDSKLMRKYPLNEIVNHSLNTTLSRTSITSITTLLVLLILVIFGGATIFSFALVMTIGVIYGTMSSLFIASPVMLFFHKKEKHKKTKLLEDN